MSKDTGGAAFPQFAWNAFEEKTTAYGGMTLRDYFAAAALQGMLSDSNLQADYFEFSRRAYEMADAMLEARK